MAVAATDITLRHFSVFDEEARQLLGSVKRLKESPHIHFISDVEDSIKLNRIRSGAVIISASGMCDAGRVLHHLEEQSVQTRVRGGDLRLSGRRFAGPKAGRWCQAGAPAGR